MSYPRDLVGYGRHTPDPKWPGGARLALQIVMNYEEGGERSILHGDAESEAFLHEVVATEPLPGVRNLNVESVYEYGSRAGAVLPIRSGRESLGRTRRCLPIEFRVARSRALAIGLQ